MQLPAWCHGFLVIVFVVEAQQQQQQHHPFVQQNAAAFADLDDLTLTFLSRYLREREQRFDSIAQRLNVMTEDEKLLPLSFRSTLRDKYHIKDGNEEDDKHNDNDKEKNAKKETTISNGNNNAQVCKSSSSDNNDNNHHEVCDSNNHQHEQDSHHHHCSSCTGESCSSTNNAAHCGDASKTQTLSLECICGSCRFEFQIDPYTAMEYCHCAGCRKYTVGPFAAGIPVSQDSLQQVLQQCQTMPIVKSRNYPCQNITGSEQNAILERWHCKTCLAPIASATIQDDEMTCPKDATTTTTKTTTHDDNIISLHIAAGNIMDDSIPDPYALWWHSKAGQLHFKKKQRVPWLNLAPGVKTAADLPEDALLVEGSCVCGHVQYVAICLAMDFQHCYCRLCRQCCGTAYQTWVPFPHNQFMFRQGAEGKLVRTTPHGQRHMCPKCGGTLTILYDIDPTVIWVAAGSFDDKSLPLTPKEMSKRLYSVRHICCDWMQPWYMLPNDRVPRRRFPQ